MRLPSLGAIVLILSFGGCATDAVVSPPPALPAPSSAVDRIDLSAVPLLLPGGDAFVTATPRDASGSPLSVAVEWSTSAPTVVSVNGLSDGRGSVIAIAAGTATITASVGSVRTAIVVTVANPNAVSLTLPAEQLTLTVGNLFTLQPTVRNPDGLALPNGVLEWSSSDPNIVHVSSGGQLTSRAVGVSTITVARGPLRAIVIVTSRPAGLVIHPLTVDLAAGDSVRLSGVLTGTNGQPLSDPVAVTWQSDSPALARVDANGWVHSAVLPPGSPARSVRITASSPYFTSERDVRILRVGLPVGVRFVHAANGIGNVTMVPSRGTPSLLTFGSVAEQQIPSGPLQVDALGLSSSQYAVWGQQYAGSISDGQHLTIFLGGGQAGGFLIPLLDDPPGLGDADVAIRIFMASNYAKSYIGNNIYLLPAGAPINDTPLACYFDLGGSTSYLVRPVGSYDIVLVDPPSFVLTPGNPGIEYARFRITPQPGRSTTYVITGSGPGSMGIIPVLDP